MKVVVEEIVRPPVPELALEGLSFTVENGQASR
jgi:hypothetical protein